MLDLCNLLHYRPVLVKEYDGTSLRQLAVVCDKYDCGQALQSFFAACLNQFFPDSKSMVANNDLSKLGLSVADAMTIAFITNDNSLFWRISRSIITTSTALEIVTDINTVLRPFIPSEVTDLLDSQRTQIGTNMAFQAQGVIAALYECSPLDQYPDLTFRARICYGTKERSAVYLLRLWEAKIWPEEVQNKCKPLREVLDALQHILDSTDLLSCAKCAQKCSMCDISIQARIKNAEGNLDGMCLKCIKESGVAKMKKDCPDHK